MSGFAVDHIVIRTPARDALVATVSAATGLEPLEGYLQAGVRQSRGVRFANGPFLDVFAAEASAPALILQGSADAAARLAAAQGWAIRLVRREERPPGEFDFPWSMALFRRGHGLLTQISIIDYAREAESWASPEVSGGLYAPTGGKGAGLARVWLAAKDLDRAAADLAALGFAPAGAITSTVSPHAGRLFQGPGCDLVLVAGPDRVVRLDAAEEVVRPIPLPGGLVLAVDADRPNDKG